MAIQSHTLEYMDLDTRCVGYLAYDDARPAKLGAVLVSHTFRGRDEFAESKARRLAEIGFAGFALDMYGDGKVGTTPSECEALMRPFVHDRALLARRISAALSAVRSSPRVDPARVAAIGYCFGGMCVLDLARSGADVRGVVSLHGLLKPWPYPFGAVTAKILALHGNDDPLVSEEDLAAFRQQMTAARADWQLHIYGGTKHAFTNPAQKDPNAATYYNAIADRRSWASVETFLHEVLAA